MASRRGTVEPVGNGRNGRSNSNGGNHADEGNLPRRRQTMTMAMLGFDKLLAVVFPCFPRVARPSLPGASHVLRTRANHILRLPVELRLKIYDFVLTEPVTINIAHNDPWDAMAAIGEFDAGLRSKLAEIYKPIYSPFTGNFIPNVTNFQVEVADQTLPQRERIWARIMTPTYLQNIQMVEVKYQAHSDWYRGLRNREFRELVQSSSLRVLKLCRVVEGRTGQLFGPLSLQEQLRDMADALDLRAWRLRSAGAVGPLRIENVWGLLQQVEATVLDA